MEMNTGFVTSRDRILSLELISWKYKLKLLQELSVLQEDIQFIICVNADCRKLAFNFAPSLENHQSPPSGVVRGFCCLTPPTIHDCRNCPWRESFRRLMKMQRAPLWVAVMTNRDFQLVINPSPSNQVFWARSLTESQHGRIGTNICEGLLVAGCVGLYSAVFRPFRIACNPEVADISEVAPPPALISECPSGWFA